jgi:Flp pilus assembly protein TadG
MASTDFLRKLRTHGRIFARAAGGNVLITFALTLVPLIGLVGAAIDYSRAAAIRTSMQAAADATALAISKNASSQTATEVQTSANTYFKALFTRGDAQNLNIKASYVNTEASGGATVTVSADAVMKTNFMGLLGYSQIPVSATSTTKWGNVRLRVALALDNTGSMSSSGKMTALKTAAKNLIDQLKAAASKNGDVYVSIIPFAKDVNVDKSNSSASWIKWSIPGKDSDGWDQNNGSCSQSGGGGWGGGGGGGGWGGGGGGGGGGQYDTEYDCTKAGGTWNPKNHNSWKGCVMDRDQDYDVKNTAPSSGTAATLFPAEQYDDCPEEIMPLSYDWTKLKNKVDAMTPNGNTNVTIGLAWGWHSLTQGAPLNAPAEDATYQYQKVIILLTDGENTQNRFSKTQSQIDARTSAACTNAKAAGITIYTVLVMEGTQSLLQNCASDPSKYFYLTSASQLVTAFNQIGTALSQLRVAK